MLRVEVDSPGKDYNSGPLSFNRRMLVDNKQFHKDIMAAKKQHADND